MTPNVLTDVEERVLSVFLMVAIGNIVVSRGQSRISRERDNRTAH